MVYLAKRPSRAGQVQPTRETLDRVRRRVLQELIEKDALRGYRAIVRIVEDCHDALDKGRAVTRQHLDAAKELKNMAGLSPRAVIDETEKDLSTLTMKELDAIIKANQLKLELLGNAAIEGVAVDEVSDMFQ